MWLDLSPGGMRLGIEGVRSGEKGRTEYDASVPCYEATKEGEDGDVRPDLLEDPKRVAQRGNSDAQGAKEPVWRVSVTVNMM